ncbi:hypothetical protein [Nocardia bhagyanarayanae]|uniref:Mercuric ion transport protein n=1 Tax=Nocardia bhagyanarayanae TaxID=1215925 RepID=A0A543FGD8_9NOCA|nr:hypothetical protein [Nocardia bhagyanarayanae]TQM32927.1 hypothetical protein FB390_4631 [Nocardia bhagyanarayanae]
MAAETRWWAPIGAGALLCLGCCVAPLLIVAGVLGSGTLLVGLSWLQPLGFALIGIGVAGLLWSRLRAGRTGCPIGDGTNSCASSGCGCTTTTVA